MRREPMEYEEGAPSYLARLVQRPLLTADEEVALTLAAQSGDLQARQKLIESNMRLVISIARSYRSCSFPLEDLIQEGAIGLVHAVERFDPNKGFRFSTYATHWIRQAIGRALDLKSKAIRLPAHVSQSLRKIERERAKLEHKLGHEPTFEQIAAEIGLAPNKLQFLYQTAQDLLSLDMKVGEKENTTLGSLLSDKGKGDPEMFMLTQEMSEELQQVLLELNERERRVMECRYRLSNSGEEINNIREELARELHISRERIRQIELQAMKKLRAIASRRRLGELTNESGC